MEIVNAKKISWSSDFKRQKALKQIKITGNRK